MGYICKNCNSSVPEGSNYCTFCGTPVEDSYINTDTKSNTTKGVVIGFVAIAIIAVVVMLLYYQNISPYVSDDLDTQVANEEIHPQEAEPAEDIFEEDDDILWGTKSDPLVYSCGGITFEIPENFGYADGYFYSEYSTLVIQSQVVGDGFWETYYYGTGKDYDELADAAISEHLDESYRELALDSNAAADSSTNPRSPFYIDPESLENEPVDGYE